MHHTLARYLILPLSTLLIGCGGSDDTAPASSSLASSAFSCAARSSVAVSSVSSATVTSVTVSSAGVSSTATAALDSDTAIFVRETTRGRSDRRDRRDDKGHAGDPGLQRGRRCDGQPRRPLAGSQHDRLWCTLPAQCCRSGAGDPLRKDLDDESRRHRDAKAAKRFPRSKPGFHPDLQRRSGLPGDLGAKHLWGFGLLSTRRTDQCPG